MASEMVERVAKAIDPDAFEGCSHGSKGPCLMCAEDVDFALYRARAAIEAMREPTEAMLRESAPRSEWCPLCGYDAFWPGVSGATDQPYLSKQAEMRASVAAIFESMIDEALKE